MQITWLKFQLAVYSTQKMSTANLADLVQIKAVKDDV